MLICLVFFYYLLNYSGQSNVTGMCGRRCESVKDVDIIGVYEFDTVSEKVVGNHLMREGVGGDPYPSPDGSELYLNISCDGQVIFVWLLLTFIFLTAFIIPIHCV